jgi:hypothetical protein
MATLEQVYFAVKFQFQDGQPSNQYILPRLGTVLNEYCVASTLSAKILEPIVDLRDSFTKNESNDAILEKYNNDPAAHLNAVSLALANDRDNPAALLIMSWYWIIHNDKTSAISALTDISGSLKSESDSSRSLDFLSLWSALALLVGIAPQ